MAAQTCSSVLCRASLQQRNTVTRKSFVAPIAQKRLVSKAAKQLVVRAEVEEPAPVDVEKVVKDLQDKWDKVENKTGVIVYGSGALVALWLASTIVGALNHLPLVPKVFELVGLGYSAWFVYRYLLFKSSREELIEDIESLKKKIAGEQ